MNTAMEYFKQVLTKVSFDRELFQEILYEMLVLLEDQEINEMETWCLSEFGPAYTGLIRSCFGVIDAPENYEDLTETIKKNI